MTSPQSPKVVRGALVSVTLLNPIPRVIVFNYNPDTLTRTLEAQTATGDGAETEATVLRGAPVEKIKLDIELDVTDQLAAGERRAADLGLHPDLAALELLVYPATSVVIANTALLALGTIEIAPPPGPFTLFIWGFKRILPVRVTDFSIVEQAHDPKLNPIRASVSLGLRVLTYSDLPVTHPGYHLFLAHQVAKEALAFVASTGDAGGVARDGVRVL